LGRHRKPSRVRLPQGATAAAAAPTLATVAAAFCLSPATAAVAAPVTAVVTHQMVLDAVVLPAGSAQAAAAAAAVAAGASTTASVHTAASALPATYRVRRGDTLASIAGHLYHNAADWPVLYWRNHRQIKWADEIYAGEVLSVPAKPGRVPAVPAQLQPAARSSASATTPAASDSVPAQASSPAPSVSTASDTTYPGGAFGACVVAAESGGNPQIMNASGHYGLYQFSYSTWVAYGGNPAEFGDATVAEQNQVFANALAEGGEDNWAPYDGC
jgi:LysM repeat protein